MLNPNPQAAMLLARRLHKDQRRKYTNEPYVSHLAEVAGIVATESLGTYAPLLNTMMCVAWLHDCMEDQGVKPGDLVSSFGEQVDLGVTLLSDLEPGNRTTRKALARERLAAAPGWVQTIKCADLISNTNSIVQHDPNFAVVYLREKRDLLAVLRLASPSLHSLASTLAQST